jgi:hypothetical protein
MMRPFHAFWGEALAKPSGRVRIAKPAAAVKNDVTIGGEMYITVRGRCPLFLLPKATVGSFVQLISAFRHLKEERFAMSCIVHVMTKAPN